MVGKRNCSSALLLASVATSSKADASQEGVRLCRLPYGVGIFILGLSLCRSPIGSCSYQDDAVSATLNFAHEESHDAAHEMSQGVQAVNPTELGNVGRTAASNLLPASCRR